MTEQLKSFQKGYKFRFYPTVEQQQQLREIFGANRFVWNQLVNQTNTEYAVYQEQLRLNPGISLKYPDTSGYRLVNELPRFKAEHPWLKDYTSVAYQQTALHLGGAYTKFFQGRRLKRTTGKPKFKSKRDNQSFSLMTTAFRLKKGKLFIAKMNQPLLPIWSRDLPSEPTSCTVTMTTAGVYHVAFVCEYTPSKTTGTKVTGIDLGLTHLAILSDGTKIDNPKQYQRAQCKLKRLQQTLSRKTKGSNNRNKARLRVASLHSHISNQRLDYLHKISRTLVNENQVIGIEALQIANMVKNRKLSKHIQSAAWGTLTYQLAYKAKESQHCVVVMMHRFYPSSHLCASTGKHIGRKLALKERTWECPHCGETHDRDVNAAQNIAIEAMAQCEFHGHLRAPHTGKVYLASKLE